MELKSEICEKKIHLVFKNKTLIFNYDDVISKSEVCKNLCSDEKGQYIKMDVPHTCSDDSETILRKFFDQITEWPNFIELKSDMEYLNTYRRKTEIVDSICKVIHKIVKPREIKKINLKEIYSIVKFLGLYNVELYRKKYNEKNWWELCGNIVELIFLIVFLTENRKFLSTLSQYEQLSFGEYSFTNKKSFNWNTYRKNSGVDSYMCRTQKFSDMKHFRSPVPKILTAYFSPTNRKLETLRNVEKITINTDDWDFRDLEISSIFSGKTQQIELRQPGSGGRSLFIRRISNSNGFYMRFDHFYAMNFDNFVVDELYIYLDTWSDEKPFPKSRMVRIDRYFKGRRLLPKVCDFAEEIILDINGGGIMIEESRYKRYKKEGRKIVGKFSVVSDFTHKILFTCSTQQLWNNEEKN